MNGDSWVYQVKHWESNGACVDYYKNSAGRWCGLPCYDDPDEAVRHLVQLGIRGGVLRRRRYSPNATDGWYWMTHNDVTASTQISKPDEVCRWVGPGRQECKYAIGLEGERDGSGRPTGWCWACWQSYRLRRVRATLENVESALADHVENRYDVTVSDWALRLVEVRESLEI